MSCTPWIARGVFVLLIGGYVGYIYYLSNPRLPLVTEEDLDPVSQRVYASVSQMCQRAGQPMPKIVIDPSEDVNAVTFGFSPKSAYITVYEGLLTALDKDDELDAVIAHEISHIANRDVVASTSFNVVLMLAEGLHMISRLVLNLGAASAGCVGQVAGCFSSFGLIGACMGLGLMFLFVYVMFLTAVTAATMFVLMFISIIAINAFQRQRERLADDYAGQLVSPDAVGRALSKLALASEEDRTMACQLLGADPQAEQSISAEQLMNAVRGQRISFSFASRVGEILAPHPLTLRRIQRVLEGAHKPGLLEKLIFPLARTLEASARWLTPEMRAAACGPSDREGAALLVGAAVGVVSATISAFLPGMNVPLALFAIGLPVGLILGIGVALILVRNGPFQGADVVDATLTISSWPGTSPAWRWQPG